jgi:hypothetical protein
MVTIGLDASRTSTRARVTLAGLLADRDASLSVTRPGVFALAGLRAKRMLGPARTASGAGVRAFVALLAVLAGLIGRHGLVLAGLTAFVVAAAQYSLVAALITGGIGAFFLELRRR